MRIPLGLWLKLIGYAFVVYLGAAVAVPAIVAIIARHH